MTITSGNGPPKTVTTLALIINGARYEGWKSVRVTRSLERAVSDFDLTVSEHFPGLGEPMPIVPQMPCEIEIASGVQGIDNQPVLKGFVDSVSIRYDASSHERRIAGRSRTCDLADCSPDETIPSEFRGLTLDRIASQLVAPFGLRVIVQGDVGAPFPSAKRQSGETIFEFLDRLAEARKAVLSDDPQGNLVIVGAGGVPSNAALRLGENILSCDADFDFSERYSRVIVRAQHSGNDQDFGLTTSGVKAEATDSETRRNRVLIVNLDAEGTIEQAQERAEYEIASRAGKSIKITYTVQGWFAQPRQLWAPGMRVSVNDDWINSAGFENLIVGEVEFSLSDQGSTTRLTLQPPSAFLDDPTQRQEDGDAAYTKEKRRQKRQRATPTSQGQSNGGRSQSSANNESNTRWDWGLDE